MKNPLLHYSLYLVGLSDERERGVKRCLTISEGAIQAFNYKALCPALMEAVKSEEMAPQMDREKVR